MKTKIKNIFLWILQVLIALGVAGPCYAKLTASPDMVWAFKQWGYPDHFYMVIGVLELLAIIGILIPRVAPYATSVLIVILCSAAVTLQANGRGSEAAFPVILTIFSIGVNLGRTRIRFSE